MKEYEQVVIVETGKDCTKLMLEHGNGIGLQKMEGGKPKRIGHMECGDGTFKAEPRENLLKAGVLGYWNGKVVLSYFKGDLTEKLK